MILNKAKIFLALAPVLCILASCAGKSTEKPNGYESQTIRINYSNNYGMVIPLVIKEMGLFEGKLPDNVRAEWIYADNSTIVRESLAANQIDIAFAALPSIITGIENGMPISILANSAAYQTYFYSNNPEISSLDGIMPHHKIALPNIGSISHLALMLAAEEKYGDQEKFNDNIIAVPSAEIVNLLASSDEIDCAAITFPSIGAVEKLENTKLILDLTPTIEKYQMRMVCVGAQEFVDKNPVIVNAVMDAVQEAMDYLNGNPSEAAEMLSAFYGGVDVSEIEGQIKAAFLSPEMSEEAYDQLAGLMFETGMLSEKAKKFSELPNYDSIPKLD
jgi:NitT/TauT family transport system substrate-binding protein